jgi:hypothetical protein
MQMVGHDGEGVNPPGTANRDSPDMFLMPLAVDVIAYDILTAIAAGHELEDRIGVLEASSSSHAIYNNIRAVGWQALTCD